MKVIITLLAALVLNIISGLSDIYCQTPAYCISDFSQFDSVLYNDKFELETWLDELIQQKMEEYHIPGLVFILVKDSSVLVSKGYGYANVEDSIPVEPGKTIFEVGSVSKLFTATAVMQLVDQGKLNLNSDVNEYLEHFKVEENHPYPLTVYNLLTHTAGFRAKGIDQWTHEKNDRIPLKDFLIDNIPPRSLPPSSVIIYSNHGYYLAGYLVEAISGLSFNQYMAKNILLPLGMEKSSFELNRLFLPDMANGYQYSNNKYVSIQPEYPVVSPSPAGSLIATGEDMARFMIAHLQGGKYQNQQILTESSSRMMQQQQFANDIRLPGTCFGFYEYYDYGQMAILHDGDVAGFSSRLFLLPKYNLGFFVCDNAGKSNLRMEITDSLMSRYFSRQEMSPQNKDGSKMQAYAKQLSGVYRPNRIGLDALNKLSYTGAVLKITENFINSLIEVEPGLFQMHQSSTRLTFREDEKGNVKYLFFDDQQMPISYEKLKWYENYLRFPRIWFGFFSVCFLWIGIIRPILIRFWAKIDPSIETSTLIRITKLSALVISIIYLIFILGFAPAYIVNEEQLAFGVPVVISALLFLPIINLVLTAIFVILIIITWKNIYWNFKKRLCYSAITLFFIGFVFYINYWNLLGFHY